MCCIIVLLCEEKADMIKRLTLIREKKMAEAAGHGTGKSPTPPTATKAPVPASNVTTSVGQAPPPARQTPVAAGKAPASNAPSAITGLSQAQLQQLVQRAQANKRPLETDGPTPATNGEPPAKKVDVGRMISPGVKRPLETIQGSTPGEPAPKKVDVG